MHEFADTELGRRLRANKGRLLRPELLARFATAFGYKPQNADFADHRETDRLGRELVAGLHRLLVPSLTWPESRPEDVFAHLQTLAERISADHRSYLLSFDDWEYIGAIRVPSHTALANAAAFWPGEGQGFALLSADGSDGFDLGLVWTMGRDVPQYELCVWGAFAVSD